MTAQEFNPVISAIVSIRHLAKAIQYNWSAMESNAEDLETLMRTLNKLVISYGSEHTKEEWIAILQKYYENISSLKAILIHVKAKIKAKDSDGVTDKWNEYELYALAISSNYTQLEAIGEKCLPEVEINNWKTSWTKLRTIHTNIKNEAAACYLQLKMIEAYTPAEIDTLTQTILKHIPINYSETEAHQYTDEYMDAFEAIKQEASQKKNLWDKFLDLLAGGIEQTPAQRVMMQRWVNGEKGDAH